MPLLTTTIRLNTKRDPWDDTFLAFIYIPPSIALPTASLIQETPFIHLSPSLTLFSLSLSLSLSLAAWPACRAPLAVEAASLI